MAPRPSALHGREASGEPRSARPVPLARASACLAIILALPGCGDKPREDGSDGKETVSTPAPAQPPPGVVATYGDGETITHAEVDRRILSAPAARRSPGEAPCSDWYEDWVREVFLERVLESELADSDFERSPSFATEARALRRNVYSEHRLQIALAGEPPVTEEDLRKLYGERRETLRSPEFRQVHHLFLRFGNEPGSSRDDVLERLRQLRRRVAGGENFGILAARYSESESRHRKGRIGFVARGELPEAADRVVFALAEGEVSEPVVVQGGAHLFFNENTVAAKDPAFEEVRPMLGAEARFFRTKRVLRELADDCDVRGSHFFPPREKWEQLVREGDPDTVILALGTFELTVRDFQQLLLGYQQRSLYVNEFLGAEAPRYLYEELKNREITFQDMLADAGSDDSAVEAIYERRKKAVLHDAYLRQKMVSWVERRPRELEKHFRNHRKRFQNLGQVRLEGVRLPLSPDANRIMAEWERSVEAMRAGDLPWETFSSEAGESASQDWGWFTPAGLRTVDAGAARIAFGMKPGEISAPYTSGGELRVFRVADVEEPETVSFERARARVAESYIEIHAHEIYAAVLDEMEEAHRFRTVAENFPKPADLVPVEKKAAAGGTAHSDP